MDTSNPLVVTLFLMAACLAACAALFVGMRSTAVVVRPGYRLGGAVAAFFLLFPLTYFIYSKLSPLQIDPAPSSIPAGYRAVVVRDAKFALAIPAKYSNEQLMSMLMISDPHSRNDLVISSFPTENSSECSNPDELKKVLNRSLGFMPHAFPITDIGVVDFAPVNGLNSVAASATLQVLGDQKQLTIRLTCDPSFKRIVATMYPTSAESTVMASTISFRP